MYNLKANFYPAKEAKNGYLGFADLTVSNAIRIRGIAVFENAEGNGHHIQFPGYGEGAEARHYVVPDSKEAYAAMLNVIENALEDKEHHFGWSSGKMNPRIEVRGHAVDEPYADGRFTVEVEGLCSLHGVSTREASYKDRDGNEKSFIAVDVPNLPPYEKNGEKIYPGVFEGLKSKYEKDGKEHVKDCGHLIRNLVLAERKKVLEQRPSLEEQVATAAGKTAKADTGKNAPVPEMSR